LYKPSEAAAPTTDSAGTRFLSTDAPTQSTRTISAIQDEKAKGAQRSSQRATAMAKLGAFGDVMQESGREAGRNAQDIGLSASKLQGWTQNVLPSLYAKANTAGKDWQGAADIMKLAAAVMSFSALAGAGKAGAEAGAENSTRGVLDQMSGTPSQFAGKDLFGMQRMGTMGFGEASASGLGMGGQILNDTAMMAPTYSPLYDADLLKYLNDPNLWKMPRPQHWNY